MFSETKNMNIFGNIYESIIIIINIIFIISTVIFHKSQYSQVQHTLYNTTPLLIYLSYILISSIIINFDINFYDKETIISYIISFIVSLIPLIIIVIKYRKIKITNKKYLDDDENFQVDCNCNICKEHYAKPYNTY